MKWFILGVEKNPYDIQDKMSNCNLLILVNQIYVLYIYMFYFSQFQLYFVLKLYTYSILKYQTDCK